MTTQGIRLSYIYFVLDFAFVSVFCVFCFCFFLIGFVQETEMSVGMCSVPARQSLQYELGLHYGGQLLREHRSKAETWEVIRLRWLDCTVQKLLADITQMSS